MGNILGIMGNILGNMGILLGSMGNMQYREMYITNNKMMRNVFLMWRLKNNCASLVTLEFFLC